MIKAAPFSFFGSLTVATLIAWLIIWSVFRYRIDRFKEAIEHLERDKARLKEQLAESREALAEKPTPESLRVAAETTNKPLDIDQYRTTYPQPTSGHSPPEIILTIEDVVMHRTGEGQDRWKNGELLVQLSAELVNLPYATVEYSAQLVFRGEVVPLIAMQDVDEWEIIERGYYQRLQMYRNSPIASHPPRSSFVTNPSPITDALARSVRNEGWLHFRAVGMGEMEIAKRTLRVYITSSHGRCYKDEELSKHHVVRSNLVAMKKPRS